MPFQGDENVLQYEYEGEYTKTTELYTCMSDFIIYKLYLNKAILKRNQVSFHRKLFWNLQKILYSIFYKAENHIYRQAGRMILPVPAGDSQRRVQ